MCLHPPAHLEISPQRLQLRLELRASRLCLVPLGKGIPGLPPRCVPLISYPGLALVVHAWGK